MELNSCIKNPTRGNKLCAIVDGKSFLCEDERLEHVTNTHQERKLT